MNHPDEGWRSMVKAWQEEPGLPLDTDQIRGELRKRFRRTLLVIGGELMVTVALIWFTVWWVRNRPPDALLLGGVWVFWALATGFTWWNRAGQWRRSAASTHEYVRMSLERARRKVRVAWAVAAFTVAEVIFITGTRLRADDYMAPTSGAPHLATASLILAIFLGWAAWYYRRARTEVEYFEKLSASLESRDPVA